jgi:hypothetical protein
LEPKAYHVLHDGRRMGPYDRRTIVGLRIKKTLSSAHQLEASDGSRLTVAQLLGRPAPPEDFNAMHSGAYSSARHVCNGGFIESEPGRIEIPGFRGEVEVRVHPDFLRIAGSYRAGRAIKDGRVKLALKDIAFARRGGSRLDLWLRGDAAAEPMQRLALDMFSDEAAGELLQWLPDARPWPHGDANQAPAFRANASVSPLLWAAVFGIALVAGFVLWVALRRSY